MAIDQQYTNATSIQGLSEKVNWNWNESREKRVKKRNSKEKRIRTDKLATWLLTLRKNSLYALSYFLRLEKRQELMKCFGCSIPIFRTSERMIHAKRKQTYKNHCISVCWYTCFPFFFPLSTLWFSFGILLFWVCTLWYLVDGKLNCSLRIIYLSTTRFDDVYLIGRTDYFLNFAILSIFNALLIFSV